MSTATQKLLDALQGAVNQYQPKLDEIMVKNYVQHGDLGQLYTDASGGMTSFWGNTVGYHDVPQSFKDAAYALWNDVHIAPTFSYIDGVIAMVSQKNTILQNGPGDLTTQLNTMHNTLNAKVDQWPVPSQSDPEMQKAVRHAVKNAMNNLVNDLQDLYKKFGNDVHNAFITYVQTQEGVIAQLESTVAQLTPTANAQGIFDLIYAQWSRHERPIVIEQVGPNQILVLIAGTDPTNLNRDNNVWDALVTGVGETTPYEQDVVSAIQQYCKDNNLQNPEITLAGHSLGGMVAQQVASSGQFNVTHVITFGSPTMSDPFPGIQYNIYAAQWDPVAMLSHYENVTLPDNKADLAGVFPQWQTNGEGYWSPAHGGASVSNFFGSLVHDVAATGHNIATTWDNGGTAVSDVAGAGQLVINASSVYTPMISADTKHTFMDPHQLYGNSIQIVPDLTSMAPNVHQQYGNSNWLKQQTVLFNVDPQLNIDPNNPHLNSTAQDYGYIHLADNNALNQYMSKNTALPPSLIAGLAHQ
jgi:pimeloyl-ACP methyl ester carboxylesterase